MKTLFHHIRKAAISLGAILAAGAFPATAQVVFSEDFGSGLYPGAPLPPTVTTYTYFAPVTGNWPDSLDDGQYVIAENVRRAFSNWVDLNDHTSGDGTGYALVVNATAGVADEFYRTTVSLAANENYEFSAWVVNANTQTVKDYCDTVGGLILPNVTFAIEDMSGNLLASQATGDIPLSDPPVWEEYVLNFSTGPSTSDVQLVLFNNAPGGCGNDLAIDDIVFRTEITMDAVDDAGTANDVSASVAGLLNVLDNDTDTGAPVSGFTLAVASGSSLPAELTFDTLTGEVGVQAGVANGVYSFDYELCAPGSTYNCDTASVSVTVSDPANEPIPAPAGAQVCTALTGFWSGGGLNWSTTTSSGLGVSLEHTIEAGGNINAFQGSLSSIGAFSEPSANGNNSLETMFYWDTSPEYGTASTIDSVSGTLTLTFDRPVYNPVVHLDKLGELNGSQTNSVYFELVTPGASITRLSGPSHFVTYTNAVYREPDQSSFGSESSLLPGTGTAAGSILVEGTHASLTFRMSSLGLEGSGYDQFELSMCGHAVDYGDAPDNYGTLKASNGAAHQITGLMSDLFMGTAPDAENDGAASANATGDGDDGVALPAMQQNVATTIPVSIVGAGYLQAWIDWDGDGSFAGAGEQIALDVVDGGTGDADGLVNGTIALAVTPPQSSTLSQTYARFRWSSAQGLASTGFASDGEVEDYALTITGSTTHNCPTGSSATGSGYASSGTGAFKDAIWWLDWSCGGATFAPGDIVNKSWSLPGGITLTAQITNISQDIRAYDTGSWAGDELVNLYGGLNPIGLSNAVSGQDPSFDIAWSANLGGTPVPVDLILADAEDLGGTEITQATTDGTGWEPIEFSGEVYAAFTLDGARIIESEPPNFGPGTLLVMSENVSNLNVELRSEGGTAVGFGFMLPVDTGDAPASYGVTGSHYAPHTAVSSVIQPAAVTLADSLTYSTLTPSASVYLGAERPDSDPTTLAGADATGDDLDKTDDEDGTTLPIISPGSAISLEVTVEGAGGFLQAWADWNADGDFADAGEQIAVDAQDSITGTTGRTDDADTVAGQITLNVSVPETLPTGVTSYIRLRWSTEQGLDLTSPAPDGEMEDYAFAVVALSVELSGEKTIEVFDPLNTGAVYAMPGEDVIYTISVSNGGNGATDADSVVLIDRMPEEVEFFNGDIDTGGGNANPGSDPVGFVDSASGLTFNYATDVAYSNQASRPANMAECTYAPQSGYDPAVTFICINPKGQMVAGDPDPGFSVSFRARIK